MLSFVTRVLLILLLTVTVAGCSAIAGIFKAGFWVGVVLAALIVVGIVVLLGKRR